MAVEEKIDVEGEVIEALPSLNFRVKLDMGHEVLAHLAGKMRRFRIRVLPGDRVRVELSPYDLTRGRITYRMKCRACRRSSGGGVQPAERVLERSLQRDEIGEPGHGDRGPDRSVVVVDHDDV